jgi:hypothetical protein
MTKKDLLQLVRESKSLLPSATPAQKIRLMKLVREGFKKLKESEKQSVTLIENADYIQEK